MLALEHSCTSIRTFAIGATSAAARIAVVLAPFVLLPVVIFSVTGLAASVVVSGLQDTNGLPLLDTLAEFIEREDRWESGPVRFKRFKDEAEDAIGKNET